MKVNNAVKQPLILIIDGANFLHRARSGFNLGEFPVVFNTFRNLRAIVEQFSPTRIYFTLEGRSQHRYELLPEYKANRVIEVPTDSSTPDPETLKKLKELESFYRQSALVIDLLNKHFPVSVVRHPEHEADDTIYNLIRKSSTAIPWVVVSSDTDFTQLLSEFKHVRLYNPITKEFVEDPDFSYVVWKSLRGDGSDNIKGLPGIGDKTADEIVNDPERLTLLFEDKDKAKQFELNYSLIKFKDWSEAESLKMTCSEPERDWGAVAQKFDEWAFKSLLKEKTWSKFTDTFDPLWW